MVWLWLPKGWRTTAFCQAAERSGVLVVPSDMFALRHSIAPPAVRLCMNAEYGIEPYIKAIDTLVHLLDNPSQDGIV
jgi:DNA-binding transcriptional MocR family regulator